MMDNYKSVTSQIEQLVSESIWVCEIKNLNEYKLDILLCIVYHI